jgi:hypothetical protein
MISKWLNPDGTVNTKALDDIEEALFATTSQTGGLMDIVTKKGFVPAFVCNHSGLYLPGDYVKMWGRSYGIGMGPDVSSEVLDSDYDTDPPAITPSIRNISQIMHPVGPCFSQVDRTLVHPSAFEKGKAIMAHEDTEMESRCIIVRENQLKNSRGRLRVLQASWNAKGSR